MKPVFSRTISTIFKPVVVCIYLAITIGMALVVGLISRSTMSNLSLEAQKINILEVFTLLNFMWIFGVLLVIFIVAFGSGIFAAEESEGTMRILVAKPVSRSSIIIGKIMGLITGSAIYMVSSLIISISIYSLLVSLDKDVFIYLLSKTPIFILYGVYIIFFFCGITSLLSSIFKKRIPAIIILILVVLFTYGVLPIVRSATSAVGRYEKYKIHLFDTNYHLGSIYAHMLEKDGILKISYNGQNSIGIFTGIFIFGNTDSDIKSNEQYWVALNPNKAINNNIILFTYTLLGISSYILCYIRMNKKDIT